MPTVYNKVTLNNTTLIDLSGDTVASSDDIVAGKVGHLNDGTQVTGTAQTGGAEWEEMVTTPVAITQASSLRDYLPSISEGTSNYFYDVHLTDLSLSNGDMLMADDVHLYGTFGYDFGYATGLSGDDYDYNVYCYNVSYSASINIAKKSNNGNVNFTATLSSVKLLWYDMAN